METPSPTENELERRRKLRVTVIWLAIGVFVAGNAAGVLGWINWGPEQQDHDQRPWVLASAAGFWIATSILLVLVVDTLMAARTGIAAPTYHDLAKSGPVRSRADWVRKKAEAYHAVVGAAGLIVGAVIAHLVWKP